MQVCAGPPWRGRASFSFLSAPAKCTPDSPLQGPLKSLPYCSQLLPSSGSHPLGMLWRQRLCAPQTCSFPPGFQGTCPSMQRVAHHLVNKPQDQSDGSYTLHLLDHRSALEPRRIALWEPLPNCSVDRIWGHGSLPESSKARLLLKTVMM